MIARLTLLPLQLVSPLVRVTAPGLPSTASSLNTLLYLDVPVNTSAVAAGGSTAKRVLVRLQVRAHAGWGRRDGQDGKGGKRGGGGQSMLSRKRHGCACVWLINDARWMRA